MRKRRKNGLAKLGMLSLSLLVALGLTGVGYSVWSDTISINVTVQMGTWGGSLSNESPTTPPFALGLEGSPPTVLEVTVTNADSTSYTGYFDVVNSGTVPVEIQSITRAGVLPGGVTVAITPGDGSQIDPGTTGGTITVSGITLDNSFTFTETFDFVLWNQ